jgi:hypothetical protein
VSVTAYGLPGQPDQVSVPLPESTPPVSAITALTETKPPGVGA